MPRGTIEHLFHEGMKGMLFPKILYEGKGGTNPQFLDENIERSFKNILIPSWTWSSKFWTSVLGSILWIIKVPKD